MRQAGQSKLGFYPAPHEAIQALLTHLENPDRIGVIFDPCAGEGAALEQVRAGLMVGRENTYACELDPERAKLAGLATGGTVLHADFKATKISPGSFSLVYCNPPFDDSQLGYRGREEAAFFSRALPLVAPGGVAVLVLPRRQLQMNGDIQSSVGAWLEDGWGVYRFPEAHRPYDEAVVIGTRRKMPGKPTLSYWEWDRVVGAACDLGQDDRVWTLPAAAGPKVFVKVGFTEDELLEAVGRSRVQELLALDRHAEAPAPPLPLHAGHVSLLLAGGMLDGLVEPPGEPPFVVRGTAIKEQYVDQAKCSVTQDDKGNTVEKTVFSERITLEVRCIDGEGTIHNFK